MSHFAVPLGSFKWHRSAIVAQHGEMGEVYRPDIVNRV